MRRWEEIALKSEDAKKGRDIGQGTTDSLWWNLIAPGGALGKLISVISNVATGEGLFAGIGEAAGGIVSVFRNLGDEFKSVQGIIANFFEEITEQTQYAKDIAAGFAAITYDSTQSLYSFNEALKRTETEGLDALTATEIRAGGTTSGIESFKRDRSAFEKLEKDRQELLSVW